MFSRTRVLLILAALCVGCVPTWIVMVPLVPKEQSVSKKRSLQNLLQPAPNIFSGGEPKHSDDFAALARLGVRTVLSVDGVRPNLELASKHGLKYVHVPVGYDGIHLHAQHSLVRLVREDTGPIYIHCHHGKHRGPAAAAIACRALGHFDCDNAIEFLKRAGTDPLYAGLYRDVRGFKIPPKETPLPELVPEAEVESLAVQMGQIDRIFDRLSKEVRAEDTVLLLEAFREAARSLDQDTPPNELLAAMQESLAGCRKLHEAKRHSTRKIALKRVSLSCSECHKKFRDAN